LFKQPYFLGLDESLQTLLTSLLSVDPEKRSTLKQVHESEFFMDPQVQTLNHLKKLSQMDLT
jgi:serine/threonine protein kinase